MNQEYNGEWVTMLAEQMVTDVTDIMVGIKLKPCQIPATAELSKIRLDGIYGATNGNVKICLQFLTEPRFFAKLAEKMCGEKTEDQELICDYAVEYVNTIYGRFLAELFRATRIKLQSYSLRYEASSSTACLENTKENSFVCLLGEENELIIFVWSLSTENGSAEG